MYTYHISGFYRIDGEIKYFHETVEASTSSAAMAIVVGGEVLKLENYGKDFHLETIHYEVVRS